jgi:hypothetical protein
LGTRDEVQEQGLQSLPDETPQPTEPPSTVPPADSEGADQATPAAEPLEPVSTPALPGVVQSESNGGGVPWVPLTIAGVVALAVGGGWLLWTLPFRNLEAGSAFYFRLRRLGVMLGVRPATSATPREFGRAMAERAPTARRQIEQIVKTYELDQYGPGPTDSRWVKGSADAWRSIRQQVPMWLVPGLRRRKNEEEV